MKQTIFRVANICFSMALLGSFNNFLLAQACQTKHSRSDQTETIEQPKVIKVFVSNLNFADIDIVRGSVQYQLFTRSKRNPQAWKLITSKFVGQPQDPHQTADVRVANPNSSEMKLVLRADCDACATVIFRK